MHHPRANIIRRFARNTVAHGHTTVIIEFYDRGIVSVPVCEVFVLFFVPRTIGHVGGFTKPSRFKRLAETFVAAVSVETETEAFPNVYTPIGF